MRQSPNKTTKKLRLKPYGVISINHTDIDETPAHHQPRYRRHYSSPKKTASNQSGIYLATVKGMSVILLVAVILRLTPNLPFKVLEQQNISQTATPATNISVNDNETTADTGRDLASGDVDGESLQSDTQYDVKTEIQASAGLNADRIILNNTEHAQDVATSLPELVQPEASTVDTHFIEAYRATIFSSMAANATQTPVARGSAVEVIEIKGSWVKVSLPESGLNGFIHITQLSIQ